MRPLLAFTQRVVVSQHGERRDSLDQRWHRFAAAADFQILPLPNHAESALALAARLMPDGLVLTGGNDLASHGGDAPERDATEAAMVAWAQANGRATLGVCRGAEFLAQHLGGALRRIPDHAGTRHDVQTDDGTFETNSYHDWAIASAPSDAEIWAHAVDGSIEGFSISKRLITAIMWHPERENPHRPGDIALFRRLFGDVA